MAIKDTLKNVANNKKQKKVGENILALTLMNGVNLLAPFVLIPYLIRVLGAEYYGIYIFAWTFIGYFLLVVNYGYDFSATKDIFSSYITYLNLLQVERLIRRKVLPADCLPWLLSSRHPVR